MAAPGAPLWTRPSVSGQLSNKLAANVTTDLVTGQVTWRGATPTSSPGSVRVVEQRTQIQGVSQAIPNNHWDSSWVGNYATSAFPFSNVALGANNAITVGNRVYVLVPSTALYGGGAATGREGIVATIVSAPIDGMNVGSWRIEPPVMPITVDASGVRQPTYDSCNPGGLAYVSTNPGNLYVLGLKGIYRCPINPDGTLGTWSLFFSTTSGAGSTLAGWGGQGGGGLIVFYAHATTSPVNVWLVNPDGTSAGLVPGAPNLGVGRQYGAAFVDPNSFVYFIGGEDGGGVAVTNTYYATLNLSSGAVGAWTGGTALPAARSRFGFFYTYSPSPFWAGGSPPGSLVDSSFAVMGGQAGTGGAGAAVATVYQNVGSGLRSTGAWTLYTASLLTATKGNAAAATGTTGNIYPPTPGGTIPGAIFAPHSALSFDNTLDAVNPDQAGICIAGSATSDVQVARNNSVAFRKGAQSTLAGSALGTGGAVVDNGDGTFTVTFPLAGKDILGFGVKMATVGFNKNDVAQLIVQIADSQSGDVSTSVPTLIKFGDAPSISGLAVSATATGRPSISFKYGRGIGGDNQATWRIWVVRNSDSAILFDTSTLNGADDFAQVLTAPMLANVAHTVHAQAASFDNPITGATNLSPDTTLALTPTSAAAPAVPSGLSVLGVPLSGWMLLNWTNAASTTENRIYVRKNGTTPWFLLVKDLLLGVGAQSVKLMDRLPYGTLLDFAVSAIAANSESALSSVVSGILTPPADSPWAFLHQAGQPVTGAGALGMVVPLQTWPSVQANYASKMVPLWGRAQPVGRQGVLDYLTVDLEVTSPQRANVPTLQSLVATLVAGGQVYYRDRVGNCFPVSINTPEDVKFAMGGHQMSTLHLVQAADTFVPYVRSGTAIGIPTLVYGDVPPYFSTMERVA